MKPHLLLLTFLIFSMTGYSQFRCDTTTDMITTYLRDNPPKPLMTDIELETKLNNSIDVAAFNINEAAYFYVIYLINCKGEDFNYTLYINTKTTNTLDTISEFSKKLRDNIQSLQSWTPGIYKDVKNGKTFDRPVDFQGSYALRVDNNRLHILTEGEMRKRLKNKRKK
jgi:hypothetical protein